MYNQGANPNLHASLSTLCCQHYLAPSLNRRRRIDECMCIYELTPARNGKPMQVIDCRGGGMTSDIGLDKLLLPPTRVGSPAVR